MLDSESELNSMGMGIEREAEDLDWIEGSWRNRSRVSIIEQCVE
jgi:hypothetical protein